jgi:hypothetical protein
MKVDPMPNQLMQLDPLSLASIGMATWLTDLMVAQKVGEALLQQYGLMMSAMPLVPGVSRAD